MCFTLCLEPALCFCPSTSPHCLYIRLTSSYACHIIFLTTLVIHNSHILSLSTENLSVSQILLNVDSLHPPRTQSTNYHPDRIFLAIGYGFLWPPCVADAATIFSSCGFFCLSFFLLLLLFPRLISCAVGDWMSTILLHIVCP